MADRISEDELRRIYRETIDTLYGFVSRRCGGQRELAEDITQETWLRAVREWRRTGAPRSPIAWLSTVARNLVLNHLRRRETISIDAVSSGEVLAAVENNTVAESADIATLVSHALAKMPRKEAQLLESFHYDRFRTAQIAEAYGISERAVEGRLRRARERLRRELEITLKADRGIA